MRRSDLLLRAWLATTLLCLGCGGDPPAGTTDVKTPPEDATDDMVLPPPDAMADVTLPPPPDAVVVPDGPPPPPDVAVMPDVVVGPDACVGELCVRINPHRGSELVNAGNVMRSPRNTMISTFGQSTQNQVTMTSPRARLRGGFVGATGGSL
jgi:hypothetical protein